ncbi:hypothetical protein PF003_g4156 [Phytophthora fragariae]|nr:hypothetical protein PF003_g4156 [Phytophthora fragariae]
MHRGKRVETRIELVQIKTDAGWRVVLPPALWPLAFKEAHDSVWVGHLRTPHTYGRIAQTYWWSHLREEVKQ